MVVSGNESSVVVGFNRSGVVGGSGGEGSVVVMVAVCE